MNQKQLKTYKVTFWRGNPQLANGGYEKVEIMRGIDENHVWARPQKDGSLRQLHPNPSGGGLRWVS